MLFFVTNTIVAFACMALLFVCFVNGGWQFGLVATLLLSILHQLMRVNNHLKRLLEELIRPNE